jgi:uncharacterized OB-fold protein
LERSFVKQNNFIFENYPDILQPNNAFQCRILLVPELMSDSEINLFQKDIVAGYQGANDEPVLLAGICQKCNNRFFPKPKICPNCLADVNLVKLGSCGTVYSFTIVRIKPPMGLPQPYAVGYIDIAGLRIFSLLDPGRVDELKIGQQVVLAVKQLGVDAGGKPCLRPYFTPVSKKVDR